MTRTNRRSWVVAGLATTLLAAGCGKSGAPEGQVVARVNGDEITQTELNAELTTANVPPDQRAKAGPAALQRVVERKLLVQAAKKAGVDKDPDYVLLRQRSDELLLAQRYLQRQSQTAQQPPSSDQVEEYLRSHPAVSDQRQILTLDQVRFPAPTDAAQAQAFQGARTMDDLLRVLNARGVRFQRDTVKADTATLPASLLASVNKLQPGEPLVIVGGPVLTAAVVTDRQPAPAGGPPATEIAKRLMVQERVTNRLKQEDASLRQGAKIDYAKGMAPPPARAAAKP